MHIGINQYNQEDMLDLVYHVGNIIHRNDKLDPEDEIRLYARAFAARKQSFANGCAIGAMSYPFLGCIYSIVRRTAFAVEWESMPGEDFWVVLAGGLFIPLFLLIRNYALFKRDDEKFWSDILSIEYNRDENNEGEE